MISTDLDFRNLLSGPRMIAVRRRRRRVSTVLYLLAVLVGVAVLALTGHVRAQAAPTTEPLADPCSELREAAQELDAQPTRYTLEGTAGLWFPSPIAALVLCEVRELRLRRRVVELDVRELRLWEQRVAFTERQRELAVEARDVFEVVVVASDRRAREAESELGAWYRSPILWVVVGIIVGGGVLIGGAYIAAAVP